MYGVTGTVVGLCGCGGHATCSVTVAIVVACEVVVVVVVVVPHVVVVAVVTPCVVSWSRLWCCKSVVSGLKKRELAEKEKRKHTSRGKPAQAW